MQRSAWATIGFGVLCFVVSLVYTGYDAIAGNRAVSLAVVEFLRDPTLYPTDPIRDTLPRYISCLWWVVTWLSQFIPLEPLEFGLFLLARALLFVAVYRLASVVAPGSLLAAWGSLTAFALVPQQMFALGTLVTSIFEQSSLSVPFVLLSVADLLQRRYWRGALWLGIVANLTVLYAVYITVYLLVIVLSIRGLRQEWKRGVTSLLLALLVATPVLLLMLTQGYAAPADVELWYKVNRFRSPFHVYPLAFAATRWLYLLLFSALVGVVGWFSSLLRPMVWWLCYAWLCTVALFLTGALLTAYVVRVPTLSSLQLARGIDLLFAPAAVIIASGSALLLDRALAAKNFWHLVGAAVLLGGGVSLWSYTAHSEASWIMLAGVLTLLIVSRLSGRYTRTDVLAVLVGVLMSALVWQWQTKGTSIRFAVDSPQYPFAQWAQRNTPKEAVFLVPPGNQEDWQSFRAISRRGVFVTWKDGTHVLFDPRYTEEWVNRIAEIGFDLRRHELGLRGSSPVDWNNINELYVRLSDEQVQHIATRYRIDYWVVPMEKHSDFPEVFRHGKWKVLQVTPMDTRSTDTLHPAQL